VHCVAGWGISRALFFLYPSVHGALVTQIFSDFFTNKESKKAFSFRFLIGAVDLKRAAETYESILSRPLDHRYPVASQFF